ncbi:hypothetical protein Hdeb2414_s0002g00049361 [Helianthus debilis subsp. tardiflorus]
MIMQWVSSFHTDDIRSSQLFRHGFCSTKLSVGDCRSNQFSSQKETYIDFSCIQISMYMIYISYKGLMITHLGMRLGWYFTHSLNFLASFLVIHFSVILHLLIYVCFLLPNFS